MGRKCDLCGTGFYDAPHGKLCKPCRIERLKGRTWRTTRTALRLRSAYICIDCESPRSVGSAERCRRCYLTRALIRRNIKEDIAIITREIRGRRLKEAK